MIPVMHRQNQLLQKNYFCICIHWFIASLWQLLCISAYIWGIRIITSCLCTKNW